MHGNFISPWSPLPVVALSLQSVECRTFFPLSVETLENPSLPAALRAHLVFCKCNILLSVSQQTLYQEVNLFNKCSLFFSIELVEFHDLKAWNIFIYANCQLSNTSSRYQFILTQRIYHFPFEVLLFAYWSRWCSVEPLQIWSCIHSSDLPQSCMSSLDLSRFKIKRNIYSLYPKYPHICAMSTLARNSLSV